MNELNDLLAWATAAIEDRYFLLPQAEQKPAYRERVYCYELYHQLRRIWPKPCAYTLNGEVDKAGHGLLRKVNADRLKPDFLVHIPGDMNGNFAVMEVKPRTASEAGIAKDLATLRRFTMKVGYQRGIYLIYGHSATARAERALAMLEAHESAKLVQVWVHLEPGASAYPLNL